jgi:hypothetical protein
MTEPMFAVDNDEADRIILEENQRREELIAQAVARFAPALARYDDVKVMHLYSTNSSLRTFMRTLAGAKTILVEHVKEGGKERKGVHEMAHEGQLLPLPASADLVATKSGLNTKTEWLAARLKAQAVVVPEGEDYIRALLERKSVLVIVGAEQAKA